MTTPTRLAEIAERLSTAEARRIVARISERAGINGYPYSAGYEEIAREEIANALTAAQARSREDAEIMREAIAQLDFNTEGVHTINDIPSTECWRCKSPTKLPAERLTHTPDCLITKLRERADDLEGRADG